jgi:hypothetical protein
MFNDTERKKADSRDGFPYSGREPGELNFGDPEVPRAESPASNLFRSPVEALKG